LEEQVVSIEVDALQASDWILAGPAIGQVRVKVLASDRQRQVLIRVNKLISTNDLGYDLRRKINDCELTGDETRLILEYFVTFYWYSPNGSYATNTTLY
jgi:hypothetical protein